MKTDPNEVSRVRRFWDGPAWRWKLALALAADLSEGPTGQADPHVLEARDYLRLRAGGPEQLERATQGFPHLAAAERLAQDSAVGGELKVLVLGDCPAADICERLRLDGKALSTWENLFFDVRVARRATDWIHMRVVQPEQQRDGHLAAQLRFAWAGGALAAKAVLDAEARAPLRQGETLFERKVRLHVKFQEVAQLPIDTDRQKVCFLKLHTALLLQEQKLRLAEQRLQQKCEEALRKQRVAERRLALQAKRAEERAAQATQREAERIRKRAERETLEQRCQDEALARAKVQDARKQAAKEWAAQCALAQLRWGYSEEYLAVLPAEQSNDVVREELAILGRPPLDLPYPTEDELAVTDDMADNVWTDSAVWEPVEELCAA